MGKTNEKRVPTCLFGYGDQGRGPLYGDNPLGSPSTRNMHEGTRFSFVFPICNGNHAVQAVIHTLIFIVMNP